MKNTYKDAYFVKHEHREAFICFVFSLVLGYIFVIVPFLLIPLIKDKTVDPFSLIIFVLGTLITFLLIWRSSIMGLYIDGKNITVQKVFKTQKIDPHDIVAIKILQSHIYIRHAFFEPALKDEHGAPLFTAFLLKSVNIDILTHNGNDTTFVYPRHIICQIIYDQKAIDYLKTLNPNIQII